MSSEPCGPISDQAIKRVSYMLERAYLHDMWWFESNINRMITDYKTVVGRQFSSMEVHT